MDLPDADVVSFCDMTHFNFTSMMDHPQQHAMPLDIIANMAHYCTIALIHRHCWLKTIKMDNVGGGVHACADVDASARGLVDDGCPKTTNMANGGDDVPTTGRCVDVDASTSDWVGGGAGQTVHNNTNNFNAHDSSQIHVTYTTTFIFCNCKPNKDEERSSGHEEKSNKVSQYFHDSDIAICAISTQPVHSFVFCMVLNLKRDEKQISCRIDKSNKVSDRIPTFWRDCKPTQTQHLFNLCCFILQVKGRRKP